MHIIEPFQDTINEFIEDISAIRNRNKLIESH